MAYIGNQTSNSYSSMDKQSITGDGGTGYTLTHAVANAQEIEVFVNNVRQEPGVAYTVSGTTLTMTGNVASTDDFYVVYQGKALQTVTPPDLSVTTAKIADDAVTSAKLDTNIDIAGTLDVTGTLTADGNVDVSGYVKPTLIAFQVRLSANQTGFDTVTHSTVVSFNTADYNNGSAFNTSGSDIGLFTCPVDGMYAFDGWVYSSAVSNFSQVWLVKNTLRMTATDVVLGSNNSFVGGNWLIKLDAGDKVGLHPYNASSSVQINAHSNHTYFRGHLVTAI